MYNFSDIYKNFPSLGTRNVLWSFNSSPISLSAKYTLHYTYNTPEHRNNAFLALYFGVRISDLPSKYSKTSSTTWWVWECASAHFRNKLGIRMHTMSTWEVRPEEMAKLEVLSRWCHAVLRLSCSRVSEWSKSPRCWRASHFLLPLSCHLSSFCWAVNHLPYIWNHSGIVSYLQVLDLDRDGIMSGTFQRGT